MCEYLMKSKYRPVGNKHKQADEAYKVWSTICLTVGRLKPVICATATGIQSGIPQAITDRKSAAHSLCRSESAAQQIEKCLSKPCRELKQHSQAAVLQYHGPHVHCGNVLQPEQHWWDVGLDTWQIEMILDISQHQPYWSRWTTTGGKLSVYNIKIISSWCQYLYVLCFIIIIMCVQFDWRFIIIFLETLQSVDFHFAETFLNQWHHRRHSHKAKISQPLWGKSKQENKQQFRDKQLSVNPNEKGASGRLKRKRVAEGVRQHTVSCITDLDRGPHCVVHRGKNRNKKCISSNALQCKISFVKWLKC